jgi:hypothetical protein
MFRCLTMAALAGTAALAACTPTFNWREVRAETAGLKAMLPCKPDKAVRKVTMAGREVSLEALGCDAGGSTFAILSADIGTGAAAGEFLSQWQAATLSRLRSDSAQAMQFLPPGAIDLPESRQVVASGQRPDGSKVQSRAAYFFHGHHVFQAVIYSDALTPEIAEPFFAGLAFE